MRKAILDDLKEIKKYDKSDMRTVLEKFPEQCKSAVKIGSGFSLPNDYKGPYANIVCTGMGGSAIGADIARSYAMGESKTPIFVNRNYVMPDFVQERSLVIASSYSGNTEETLSAFQDARKKRARAIAITSGGEIKKLASSDGCPVLEIPGGLQPRCALGLSFFTLLALMSKIGIVRDQSRHIDETIGVLESMVKKNVGMNVPETENIAKRTARLLHTKFPVIYGSADLMDSVITRWKGQLAENSKTLSSGHVVPEMNHNEIVGWEFPAAVIKNFIVLMLRDSGENKRVSKRLDITERIINKQGVKTIKIESLGKGLLARIMSLVYIGDFTSYYLAILNKVDPAPVDRIAYLKKELSKG